MGELDRNGGYNCRNIIIRGKGAVLGGGRVLMENIIKQETGRDFISDVAIDQIEREARRTRGRLINISNTQNVVIYGIEAGLGPAWNIHMIYSDNVVTAGCYIHSEDVNNGDGWDPDSSTNCTIFASEFFTGDDAVAIKSGKNPEGNVIAKPSEHIRVFDCISHFGHGLTIGSEMSGGINDIRIWNCDMTNSFYGVEIKGTKKRGGYVKGVHVSYCTLARVLMHSVGYNDDGIGAPTVPVFSDCTFEELTLTAKQYGKDEKHVPCEAIYLAGFDVPGHAIKNVKFKNVTVDGGESIRQTIYMQCCDGVTIENIKVK
jgi:polygalacturonase